MLHHTISPEIQAKSELHNFNKHSWERYIKFKISPPQSTDRRMNIHMKLSYDKPSKM